MKAGKLSDRFKRLAPFAVIATKPRRDAATAIHVDLGSRDDDVKAMTAAAAL
jgi:hypothetical protein